MKKLISLLIISSLLISLISCNPISKPAPTVNGVNLKDYTIVYDEDGPDYNKRAAEYIQTQAKERFGKDLEIIDDGEAKRENEIVVGETCRDISKALDAECQGVQFSMMAKDGSIALEGDYFIIAAAAYFFVDSYMPEGGGDFLIDEEAVVRNPIVKKAKNYIMLIGDGMGFYHTKSFEYIENNVEYGDGEDVFYGYMLPYQGLSKTNSLSGTTDSAAGATALACGYKTFNGYVGRNGQLQDVKNLTELAHEIGKSAAIMSTETQTGATPASFVVHVDSRNMSSAIINLMLDATINNGTVIECGFDYYNTRYMGVIEGKVEKVLDQVSNNDKGFFLMYEEAYIDKHCDDNDFEKSFNAMVRFNQVIARFMEFVFYNPETAILITADHETGGLHEDENGTLAFVTTDHTSADVPIFAYGHGMDIFNGAHIENIQIAHTIAALMGDENFGDQSQYQSLTKTNK
jgi:alkaline phosphatase